MTAGEETRNYCAREVVGAFSTPNALEVAVDELEIAGFDRARISVLATDAQVKERVGHLYRSAADVVDDRRAPRAAFASRDSRIEGEAAAVGVPFQIGGFAGAAAVVAAGGTLAAAIAAMILSGAVAGGLGALLALAVARRHAESVRKQLAQGGLVLWVSTPDETSEQHALAVLQKCGAKLVHVHSIEREWGPKDRPFQFDPFLEPDPKPT
jgi:VIT1/CCC1 family predicted Fe2+/Mn2+ transporter